MKTSAKRAIISSEKKSAEKKQHKTHENQEKERIHVHRRTNEERMKEGKGHNMDEVTRRIAKHLLGRSGGLLLVDDGMRAAADLAEAANDLEDDEDGGNNKEVDGSDKVVRTVLGLVLERDDEQDRNEDERDSLASPRKVERHERAQLGRHEDLNNNDVKREDAVW